MCFSGASISPAVIDACVKHDVGFSALSQSGRFCFRLNGPTTGNVLLRKKQYTLPCENRLYLAKRMLHGKLEGQATVLGRFRRNHPSELLRATEEAIRTIAEQLPMAVTNEGLRGLEGQAARLYFDAFGRMILTEDKAFRFEGRNRRPPRDRCNAMLSFGYTLLAEICVQAVESVGLDPQVGFLHSERPGKPALALDLMEEPRAQVADRHALRMINLRMVSSEMFETGREDGVFLDARGRKCFLREWNRMWRQEVMVPELGQRVARGLLPYLQAARLARYLRGDEKMLVVIVYDISTAEAGGQKRLRKVARLCRDWGISVQDSVYECELDASQYRSLKEKLGGLIQPDRDSIRFYLLGNRFQRRIETLGRERVQWDRETYVI